MLGDSLVGMSALVTRALAEVRIEAGVPRDDRIVISELFGDVALASTLQAQRRDVHLSFEGGDSEIAIVGDSLVVASIVTNLVVQNACKFTREHSTVVVSTRATDDRIFIDVTDECGGLPAGVAERRYFCPTNSAVPIAAAWALASRSA